MFCLQFYTVKLLFQNDVLYFYLLFSQYIQTCNSWLIWGLFGKLLIAIYQEIHTEWCGPNSMSKEVAYDWVCHLNMAEQTCVTNIDHLFIFWRPTTSFFVVYSRTSIDRGNREEKDQGLDEITVKTPKK